MSSSSKNNKSLEVNMELTAAPIKWEQVKMKPFMQRTLHEMEKWNVNESVTDFEGFGSFHSPDVEEMMSASDCDYKPPAFIPFFAKKVLSKSELCELDNIYGKSNTKFFHYERKRERQEREFEEQKEQEEPLELKNLYESEQCKVETERKILTQNTKYIKKLEEEHYHERENKQNCRDKLHCNTSSNEYNKPEIQNPMNNNSRNNVEDTKIIDDNITCNNITVENNYNNNDNYHIFTKLTIDGMEEHNRNCSNKLNQSSNDNGQSKTHKRVRESTNTDNLLSEKVNTVNYTKSNKEEVSSNDNGSESNGETCSSIINIINSDGSNDANEHLHDTNENSSTSNNNSSIVNDFGHSERMFTEYHTPISIFANEANEQELLLSSTNIDNVNVITNNKSININNVASEKWQAIHNIFARPTQKCEMGAAFREHHFVIDKSMVFVNQGAFGSLLAGAIYIKHNYELLMEHEVVEFMDRHLLPLIVYSIRRLSSFIHANPRQVVFVQNATFALNAAMRLIDGDDVVAFCDTEYLAVYKILWFRCQEVGAKMCEVMLCKYLHDHDIMGNDAELTAEMLRQLPANCSAIVLDFITSTAALHFPLFTHLIPALRRRGVRKIIVDGAHGPMQIDLNFNALPAECQPSVFVGNLHKWFAAPKSVGFMWVREEDVEDVSTVVISHGAGNGLLSEFIWDGTRDYGAYLTVPAILDFWQRQGYDRVRGYCSHLLHEAVQMLTSAFRSRFVARSSPFMSLVELPEELQDDFVTGKFIQDVLHDHFRIEVPVKHIEGRYYIRISAFVYNTPDEYVYLKEAILLIADRWFHSSRRRSMQIAQHSSSHTNASTEGNTALVESVTSPTSKANSSLSWLEGNLSDATSNDVPFDVLHQPEKYDTNYKSRKSDSGSKIVSQREKQNERVKKIIGNTGSPLLIQNVRSDMPSPNASVPCDERIRRQGGCGVSGLDPTLKRRKTHRFK